MSCGAKKQARANADAKWCSLSSIDTTTSSLQKLMMNLNSLVTLPFAARSMYMAGKHASTGTSLAPGAPSPPPLTSSLSCSPQSLASLSALVSVPSYSLFCSAR